MATDLAEQAVERLAAAVGGLPVELVEGVIDLVETVVHSSDVSSAIARAKQNALADVEDAAAEAAAEALIRSKAGR